MIVASFVSTKDRNVMEGRTDRRRDTHSCGIYSAGIACMKLCRCAVKNVILPVNPLLSYCTHGTADWCSVHQWCVGLVVWSWPNAVSLSSVALMVVQTSNKCVFSLPAKVCKETGAEQYHCITPTPDHQSYTPLMHTAPVSSVNPVNPSKRSLTADNYIPRTSLTVSLELHKTCSQ